jgi:hypothetical protein
MVRGSLLASLALCLAAVTLAAEPRLTKQDADRFRAKLDRILQAGNSPAPRRAQPLSTPLTDVEVNSYLRYGAGKQIPTGIVEPTLNALGNADGWIRWGISPDGCRSRQPDA